MTIPSIAMKARFLATADHDLRQPLQTLGILTELLRRRIADPETGALVERQEAALWLLRQSLQSFLDLSRIDCGAIVPAQRVFPLHEVMEGVQDTFGERMRRCGMRFDIVSSSAIVHTDSLLLQRIAEIIVGTVMQYGGAHRIVLGVRRHAERSWLETRYDGDAVAPQRIAAALHDSPPGGGSEPGFGIGLSVARHFADLLGLDLVARGGAGCIASIDLSLPVVLVGGADPPP